MKQLLIFLLPFLSVIHGYSQSNEWKELEDFHHALAFTFHPMMDDSNFAPIRKRSAELMILADSLEKSADKLIGRSSRLEMAVKNLAAQTRALDEVIHKNATEADIRERLTAIHEKFHEIERLGDNRDN